MQINSETYEVAQNALKDILYMFVDVIVQDGDFSELALGSFDPFQYLNVSGSIGNVIYFTDGEVELLRKGAAITLLANIADVYFDDDCHCISDADREQNGVMPRFCTDDFLPTEEPKIFGHLKRIKAVYDAGKIIENRYIQNAFKAAFVGRCEFMAAMRDVLDNVIKCSFEALAAFDS